ncbi:hypothetical protein ABT033_09775 [Streptomyces pharetrae]|uniref:hypothetical protein n=1 Tax=Streptomyces pharetrae TaxID=291370 RepID=UPI00334C4CB2
MKDVTQLTGGRSPRHGDDVPAVTAPAAPAEPPAADASRSPGAHEPGSGGGPRAPDLPVPDKDVACPAPRHDAGPEPVPGQRDGADAAVSAHTLVGNLLLRPGRHGPTAARDRGPQARLPGERARTRVRARGTVAADEVSAAPFPGQPA